MECVMFRTDTVLKKERGQTLLQVRKFIYISFYIMCVKSFR